MCMGQLMETKMKITAFLPCRKGSQRVPKKNIKPFGEFDNGLIEIKLKQLLETSQIDKIVLSTNDEEIITFAQNLNSKKIYIHKRDDSLASSATSTDELVTHALELIPDGHILWTHVTSPFINSHLYSNVIDKYIEILTNGYDSLMTSSLVHGFLWNQNGPINYDRTQEKWPRTQTIEPLHEINSGMFINSTDNYRQLEDRIGKKPYLYTLDKIEGFDIDWEDDFKIAECILSSNVVSI